MTVTVITPLSPSNRRAMNKSLKPLLGIAAVTLAAHASAQVTFYEGEGFRGRTFAANGEVRNFAQTGFNDRASSVVVDRGRWEVCEDAFFKGRCVVLRRGSYDSLGGMGMENRISSVRRVDDRRQYDNEVPYSLARPELRVPSPSRRAAARGPGHLGARRDGAAGAALLGRDRARSERRRISTCRARSSAASSAASSATRSAAAPARRWRRSPARSAAARSAPTSIASATRQSGQGRPSLRERRRARRRNTGT